VRRALFEQGSQPDNKKLPESSNASTSHASIQQQLQQQREAKRAIAEEMLMSVANTNAQCAETLAELDRQGEQLARAHDKVRGVHEHLSMAEQHLHRMEHFFPSLSRPPQPPQPVADTASDRRKAQAPVVTSPANQPRQSSMEQSASSSDDAQLDMALEQITNGLQLLQNQSRVLGAELDRQNAKLGGLEQDVDTANSRLRQDNRRVRNLM